MSLRLVGLLTILIQGCEAAPITTTPDSGIENDAGSPVADAGTIDAGGPLWPVAALKIEATSRGGFPTPYCASDAGMINGSTWSLMIDGRLDFVICELPYPTALRTGSTVVDAGQLARLDAAMGALTRSTRTFCGADARTLVVRIETDAGTLRYADDFYACNQEPGTTWVQGIDGVFNLLAEWTLP